MSMQNKTYDELRAQAGPQKVEVKPLGVKKENELSSDQDDNSQSRSGSSLRYPVARQRGAEPHQNRVGGASGNLELRGSRSGAMWSPTESGLPELFMGADLVDDGSPWYGYGLIYSGQGDWCSDYQHISRPTKTADYKTCVYFLRLYFTEADGSETMYDTWVRMNLPWDYDGDYSGATDGEPHFFSSRGIGVVLLVTGSGGTGVHCTERLGTYTIEGDDDIAAVLAMGAVPRYSTTGTALGRLGEPMVTVTFNRPSRGAAGTFPDGTARDTQATGVAAYQGYAINNDGDDDGGPETTVFIEAVMQMALEIVQETYDSPRDVDHNFPVIVSSFSNGAAGAARWLRYTSVPVHAFIEAEGPSDSLEKTVATECYDPFGEYGADELPTYFNAAAWANAAAAKEYLLDNAWGKYLNTGAYREKFGPSLKGLNLPPLELVLNWIGEYSLLSGPGHATGFVFDEVQYPVDIDGTPTGRIYGSRSEAKFKLAMLNGEFGHGYFSANGPVSGYLLDVAAYWSERTLEDNLPHLPADCIYVRINGKFDHVQPRHYLNRHAVRAVVAAQSSGNDVFLADQDYWDDMQVAGLGGTDPTDASTYASLDYDDELVIRDIWPDFGNIKYRNHVRVDLTRWAFDLV